MARHGVLLLSILAASTLALGCQSSTRSADELHAMISLDQEVQALSAAASLTDPQRAKVRTVLEVALRSRSIALLQRDPAPQLARLRTQIQQALFTVVAADQKPQVKEYITHSLIFNQS
jgi:hypothetical protein